MQFKLSNIDSHAPAQKARIREETEFIDDFDDPHLQLLIFDHIRTRELTKLKIPFSRIPVIHNNEHQENQM